MANEEKNEKDGLADNSSLETPSTTVEQQSSESGAPGGLAGMDDVDALEKPSAPSVVNAASAEAPRQSFGKRVLGLTSNINPYLMLFIAVLMIAVIIVITISISSKNQDPANILFEGQDLSQETLDEILTSESTIGTVDQTLTVAANSIFNGKVLIKDSLDVAGAINVGGALSLPGITVSGESNFENVNVSNNLAILGSASIQQNLTVQQSLDVTGNVAVGGVLSAAAIRAESIQFAGDASFTRHIDTGGSLPSISSGTAVGAGGTVSVSGNDIAGTVTINTGGSPPAGFFATINFVAAYNSTPNVQITPVGSSGAGLNYYVTRDTNGFRIGTTNAPSSGTTYTFDYFVTE